MHLMCPCRHVLLYLMRMRMCACACACIGISSVQKPVCSNQMKAKVFTTTPGYGVPASGGELEYTGRMCGNSQIFWEKAEANGVVHSRTSHGHNMNGILGTCGVRPTAPPAAAQALPTECQIEVSACMRG